MGKNSRLKQQRRSTASHGQTVLNDIKTRMPIDDCSHEDLTIIGELIDAGRQILRMHVAECKGRIAAHEAGYEPPKRWQVSPTVSRQVITLLEKLLNIRRIINGQEPILIPKPTRKKAEKKELSQTMMPGLPLLPA